MTSTLARNLKMCFAGMAKKIRLDWWGRIGRNKGDRRNDVDEVNMDEGGGGSCCIQSI